MTKRNIWKIWLRLNRLTAEVKNDYVAEVSTVGKTLANADIARLVIEAGSELSYETLLDVLDRTDRVVRGKICEGYSVQRGECHITPRVLGTWLGATHVYDSAHHRITCDMTLTKEMRKALESVGIEVLGIRDSGAYIGLVTDVTTGLTDGSITPGGQVIIDGDKIKIEPYDNESIAGVFIENEYSCHRLWPLAVNRPKEIIALLPANMEPGEYKLYVKTQFTRGGVTLKEIRQIDYNTPLTVG